MRNSDKYFIQIVYDYKSFVFTSWYFYQFFKSTLTLIFQPLHTFILVLSLIQVEFCETVLPYLIHDILLSGNNDHREVLSRQADNFFSCHCGHTSGRISRCQSTMSASLQLDQGRICNWQIDIFSVRRASDS